MQIKPLFRDPITGYVREAQSGDVLSTPVIGVYEEYVTLFENAEINTCCALIEYTAIPINSVNTPNINYRHAPAVDCVLLESGTTGQTVKAALTHGKLYSTSVQIDYTNSDTLYLGRDSKLTTVVPSLINGDNWGVIVGRLINHNEFIFDPQLPIDFNSGGGSGGNVPSPIGHPNTFAFSDGFNILWKGIKQSDISPDAAINSFSANISTLEIGQQLSTPGFTASYNEQVISARLKDNQYNIWNALSNFTNFNSNDSFVFSSPNSVIFTLEATLSSVLNSTTTINWMYRKFWGTSTNLIQIDSLQFSGLSDSRSQTFTVTAAENEYIYLAIPVSFGNPTFYVGGFEGGISYLETKSYTNSYGIISDYNIYKSDNHSLGTTMVTIS